VDVPGEDDGAFDVGQFLRALAGDFRGDPVVDVGVELVEGDVAVVVQVGLAGSQAGYEMAGEDGWLALARQVAALEGVLGGIRGGQHHAAAASEPLQGVDLRVGLRGTAGGKGAAVAAVEDQDLLAGRGGIHRAVDVIGGQGGEQQAVAPGVGHGEVQVALFVLQAVAGEVDQGQVLAAAAGVEVAQGLAHQVVRLVDQRGDLEAGDVRVLQHRGQRFRVMRGRDQLAELGILVGVGGDQQGHAAAHGHLTVISCSRLPTRAMRGGELGGWGHHGSFGIKSLLNLQVSTMRL
jgi:hypothetical protein